MAISDIFGLGNLVGGRVSVGDNQVTISSGGQTYTVTAPNVGSLGINPTDTSTYHIYSDQHVLGPVSNFNGPTSLWDNLLEEPAPALPWTNSTIPVGQGQIGYAPMLGPVTHYHKNSAMTVINITNPGHMLYPGIVTRTLEAVDGNYVITTYGIGNGQLPGPNDALSNQVWSYNTGRIASDAIDDDANRDRVIQTSRDIVAGRHIDPTTGQRTYADAAIRAVAAAQTKREQEIAVAAEAARAAAEAAAWQQEYNRDRQGGGDSSYGGSSAGGVTYGGRATITSTHTIVTNRDGSTTAIQNNYGSVHYNNVVNGNLRSLPIVLDLDGDGVEISPLGGSTARFDYDNDGFRERATWVGSDDGLLVYDIGVDGQISEAREVVRADWTADTTDTDLEAQRKYRIFPAPKGLYAKIIYKWSISRDAKYIRVMYKMRVPVRRTCAAQMVVGQRRIE